MLKYIVKFTVKGLLNAFFGKQIFFIVLVLLFAFGFMSGAEHFQINQFLSQNHKSLFFIFLLWIVYSGYCLFTLESELVLNKNKDLFLLSIIDQKQFWVFSLFLYAATHVLSLAYGLIMINYVIVLGDFIFPFYVLGFHVFMAIAFKYLLGLRLSKPMHFSFFNATQKPRVKSFKQPAWSFYLKEAISNNALSFILVKTLSLGLVFGISNLYLTDDYDYRLFGLAGLLLGFLQFPVLKAWFNEEASKSYFLRSLPLNNIKYFMYWGIGLVLLLSLEFLAIFYKSHNLLDLSKTIELSIFMLGLGYFIMGINYLNLEENIFGQVLFFSFVGLSMLIMFKINMLILGLLLAFTAFIIFKKKYFGFEVGRPD